MPTMDEGSVIVQLTKLPSINLDQSVAGDLAVQRALRAVPEVEDADRPHVGIRTKSASIRWASTRPTASSD